ncbi:hypothetical protein Tco_0710338 [Tanacetum coccineum]
MAAVEVPQTLEYKGGQLNAAPVLEVEIFTNWKKRILLAESQRNTTNPTVTVTDSSVTEIISLEREINPRNPQHTFKGCEACGSLTHTTTDHYDIEWFKRGSIYSEQYWTKGVATACYTQNKPTIVKRHLKTSYEIFCKKIPNINFLHVFGCPIYIHNHKDHLGKFDEKSNDGYLLGHSLVSNAIRTDNINIAEKERYPPDEYLHPYDPSQRYQTNSNDVSFIEPYECLEPVVLETKVSSDQNGQTNQNDQSVQNDEILNDDHSEHSNHQTP